MAVPGALSLRLANCCIAVAAGEVEEIREVAQQLSVWFTRRIPDERIADALAAD